MSDQLTPPDQTPRRPSEQVVITFFDLPCLAVRDQDGSIYVSLNDLCTALGVDRASQMRRIRSHMLLRDGLARFLVRQGTLPQVIDFLQLQTASNWLVTINATRVAAPVRDRLVYLQAHLFEAVWRAFTQLTGLPEGPTRSIEDLDDLQRIDPSLQALETLAQRQQTLETSQQTLETSQERARAVWRTLQEELRTIRARMDALEQAVGGTISKAQRGYLYQLVQAWATARAEHTPRMGRREVFAATWAEFKTRFALARYEDLPLSRYAEAVTFISERYHQLTGQDLDIPEQEDLDLT